MEKQIDARVNEPVSLAQKIQAALSDDGRFQYYPQMDYRVNKDESKSINQFAFYDLVHQIDDPRTAIRMGFVLQAVHVLGNATRNMILNYLLWMHRAYPDKMIPAVSEDVQKNQTEIGKILKRLLDKGLLVSYDYVTEKTRKRIVVYACTQYGWIYYRNKLQVQTSYDTNAVFRTDVEVLKRLSVASVATTACTESRCTGVYMNDQNGSKKYQDVCAYTYGILEFDDGGENGSLLVLEPVYFRFDPKILTEEENQEKMHKRFEKLGKAVEQLEQKYETMVRVCFIVEDQRGLTSLFHMIEENTDDALFKNVLITSDNIIYNLGNNLSNIFLKVMPKKDHSGLKVAPAADKWLA